MSATVSVPSSQRWLPRLLSGRPHQIIGPPDQPYLLRWFIIPTNPWCNICWQFRFIDSDDPVPHCHPWDFLSTMLCGSYFEADQHGRLHRRRAGHIALRRAEHRHRIILADHPSYGAGAHRPATTVIITGPHRRQWGFWCEGQRFVPWREFGAGGCGEDNHRDRS
jgi:hypothetical protein